MFSFRPIIPVLLALALGQSALGAPVKRPKIESPKVDLLPRAQKSGGVEIQISAAGFGAPANVSRDEGLRENRMKGFYFSYFARAQNAALEGRLNDAVQLTGLFAPDGSPLPSSAAASILNAPDESTKVVNPIKIAGGTQFFTDVLPSWKSVRAEFEVRNLLAPPGDAGIDRSAHVFKDVALPALGEKITELAPDLSFETERGTKVKLVKIERERRENRDRGHVRFFWHVEPLASATNYNVEIENCRIVYDVPEASDGGYSDKKYTDSTDIQIEGLNASNAAKSATLSFDFVESARGWRKASAFSLISFEIPVAKIWKAAPLKIQTPPVAPVAAKNADFEATWESLGDTSRGGWADMKSQLWMRDLTPDATLGAWTPKSVEFPNGERSGSLFNWATPSEGVFHADNSIRRAGETGYSLRASDYMIETAPAKVDLQIKAQRARTFLTGHAFKNVPLPARNSMREYGPNEFNDGIWKLRRVIWAEDEALKKQLGNSSSWLILTFERDPKTAFEGDGMMLVEKVLYDEKGVVDRSSSMFNDGDPMTKGTDKTHISLFLSPPARGATHFSANFRVIQQVWSGPIQTLILPAVPIVAVPKH